VSRSVEMAGLARSNRPVRLVVSDQLLSEWDPINQSHDEAEYPTQETRDIMLAGVDGSCQMSRVD
jgi:hemin uptake protein HemP